jgi:RNA polymerase sigma factor (sigma-70 family)
VTRLAQHDAVDQAPSAAAGDEIAFRRIIATHHDDMRRVCVYVAGDRAIAEEATQAAWVIAWKRIGSVRQPARLRPWLMAVAVNEARQLLRNRRRRAEIPLGCHPQDGFVSRLWVSCGSDPGETPLRKRSEGRFHAQKWWGGYRGLNPKPSEPQSDALPIEL